MGAVDAVFEEGLLKMRDAMVDFSNRLDPQADTNLLSATDVPWNFNWGRCRKSIANAAERTAHERFEAWYIDHFRGTKRSFGDIDNLSYDGSDSNTSSSSKSSPASLSPPSPPLTRSRARVLAGGHNRAT